MKNTVELRKSNATLEEWLADVAGDNPSGKDVKITRVEDGEVHEVWFYGHGPVGYYADAVYAGSTPEYVKDANNVSDGSISNSSAMFRLTAPCVVYEVSGYLTNGGRTFRNNAIVCATDEQIEAAKQAIAQLHQAKIKKARG